MMEWPSGMQLMTTSFPGNSLGMLDPNAVAIGTSPRYSLGTEHPFGQEFAAQLRPSVGPCLTIRSLRGVNESQGSWDILDGYPVCDF
jgi:hypothetical protein